jgi:pyrroline-5-carboxylate reductase
MSINARIGIIGGNGWLGSAIAQAAVESGWIAPHNLTLSSRSGKRPTGRLDGVDWTQDNDALVERCNVIVLSVRPEQFAGVHIDARGKFVVSVMAGVSAHHIAQRTKADQIVRSIPNAAAAIRQSFTPWYAMPAVSKENKEIVQGLFDACGEAAEVSLERHIDYCVGMTGSGAAFPALLAQALISHAVSQGLPESFARRAASGVTAGASQLLRNEGCDPKDVVAEMIDYRGTTAAALEAMIAQGFDRSVAAGLEAASAKAEKMGVLNSPNN